MTTRRGFLTGALALGGVALSSCTSGSPGSSVPSPSSTGTVTDAQTIAELALWTAARAAEGGSYGIGGVLVEQATGTVLATMPNRVFAPLGEQEGVMVQDPTAHGERQLMSWYLAQRTSRPLPRPEELTVVTTVDPCLMCASSLLEVGVGVGVIAPDPYSGINFTMDAKFDDLPESLRRQAQGTFGYYAVDGVRSYQGGSDLGYAGQSVAEGTYNQCVDLYAQSADTVRAARRSEDTSIDSLTDPAKAPGGIPIMRAFEAASPGAFSITVKDPRMPGDELRQLLQATVRASPGSTNACAFLDPFGNVLSVMADQQSVNALSTAFALCTRAYAQTRFAVSADKATARIAAQTLTNPDRGTFVWLTAPDFRTAAGMFDIGAYGSTMGSAATPLIPSAFQYYSLPPGVSADDLQRAIPPLPPLYSKGIGILPQQVASAVPA